MKRSAMESKRSKKAKRGSLESKSPNPPDNQNLSAKLTGNEQSNKDIFIEIEPSSTTNLVVTDQPPTPTDKNQQVVIVEKPNQDKSTEHANENVQIEMHPTSALSVISSTTDLDDQSILPDTVTKLTTTNGSEVFLIGTAHFSHKSAQDVKNVIRHTKPSAVILELCKERAFMLTLDETSLLEQNKKLSFDKIKSAINEKGLAQGLIYIMFIKMSANLTEKLGMAPGSEFRAGAVEAREIPGCSVVLGDRSLKVTMARAVASISLWQKMKLIYQVLSNDFSITQEDVEKCKEKDILEQMLQELGGEFPGFKRVILDERNIYLAHSIYQWAQNFETSLGPQKVVAIVGVGHIGGIVENWGKTTDDDIKAICEIPKTSKTKRIVTNTIKYCTLALFIYVGYRTIIPSSVQEVIHDKIVNKIVGR